MSIVIASLIVLVIVAIVLVPVLVRVFGEAARRNPNQPDAGEEQGEEERRE